MKFRVKFLILTYVCVFAASALRAVDAPKPFDDPALYEKVVTKLQIAREDIKVTDPNVETLFVLRAYYPKNEKTKKVVGKKDYIDLITNYEKYPDLFPRIGEASGKPLNKEKTKWKYSLEVEIKAGFFVTVEGEHAIENTADLKAEAKVLNRITNMDDIVDLATENTRIIPYNDGLLVEDEIHLKLKDSDSQSKKVRDEVIKTVVEYVGRFRKELSGTEIQ